MRNLHYMLIMVFFSLQTMAQEKAISGTISDENGIPLPGVTIIIKGTTQGTQTDFDGNYSIKAQLGDILQFSFLGYRTVEKTVGISEEISFAMEVDSEALEEVVVTALGIKRKSDQVTHAYQSVNIGNNSNTYRGSNTHRRRGNKKGKQVSNSLSGRVSGLQINSHSSNVNRVVLRGNRSVSNGQQALIVIDGVISNSETLAKLSPQSIQETHVIKGAGGSALYGSQGANGVVVVLTKDSGYKIPHKVKKHIHHSTKQEFNTETYEEIVENNFENVKQNPLSTFSIDVDKASYSNIRRMINNGESIPANAVKIEEMVNYFNYHYPQPTDNHPFSINTELVQTPWNADTKLVKIGLQGKTYENDELPASNLTFLIDVSGSMGSANKLPLLKSAFKLLVNQLRDKDKVSIVVYAGAAGVVLEPTSGSEKKTILEAIKKLESGGSTAGGQGIELAYKLASKHFIKDGNNRVILATDGDFNVGISSDNDMKKLIEKKRESGVFLSVLGFGYGNYKDSKLEILADKGNGNHAYIDTMQEAQKVFGKEFGGTLYTIAKDVKIQVEFNPQKVQAYRLIGYENRLLADEDFKDDTIDAGELGSGHTVTALYEVIPVGVSSKYLKDIDDLKYSSTSLSSNYSDELLTVKFRYKKPDGKKSIEMIHIQEDVVQEPTPDMNFASAVALFGMQLRDSKYHNDSKIKDVLELADVGRGQDIDGYRSEFIRLVESSRSLQ